MTTDIFIKTCNHDKDYHEHCLASIERHCRGFSKTVVVDGEHPNGYLEQQVVKLHADLYCDGDYILVTDSDTLFSESVSPDSFMRDDKPIWMMTPWDEEMMSNPGTKAWFDVMGQYFSKAPPFEFMRRQPFMFPRHVLTSLRAHCLATHGMSIEQYIYGKGVFSEWNVLGMFCYENHRDDFYWMDSTVECPTPKVRQFWSHAPIEYNLSEIQQILS
jgi:hypothetical protein